MKFIMIFILSLLFFSGCNEKENRPMVLSTNLWIGYSPLYYAEKKGWLREHNIKLVRTISLAESLETFNTGNSDLLCSTQYEIQNIIKKSDTTGSVILLDRSYGGDYVLSNRSIETLKKEPMIDVYLEVDSVSSLMLEYFMEKHELKKSQMNLINSLQILNSKLPMRKSATLIVTYDPYNLKLQKKGYREVGSSKDDDLLIVDAIYAPKRTQEKFKQEVQNLNTIVYNSLKALQEDPKEYFEAIKPYFYYKDYEEFLLALKSIKWLYHNRTLVKGKRDFSLFSNKTELIEAHSEEF